MPSLLAEQRIGIEYAPITNVTEEREADWRIILRIYIKRKKQKTKTKTKETTRQLIRLYSFCPAVLSFVQSAGSLSSALARIGEGGDLLPSSKIEDREEKADYFTVVVLRRLEIQESARVRGT